MRSLRSSICLLVFLAAWSLAPAQPRVSTSPVDSLLRYANRCLLRGSVDTARTLFESILSSNDTLLAARFGLVRVAIAEEQWGDGADICDDILKKHPQNLAAHYYAGICYRELGSQVATLLRKLRWDKAYAHFGAVIGKDSLFNDVVYQLAVLNEYDDKLQAAIALGHRQILVRPDLSEAQIGLFRIYRHFIAVTDSDDALSWLRQQDNQHAQFFTAEVLRRYKAFPAAEAILLRLLNEPGPVPEQACRLSLARIYASRMEDTRAEASYWKAVDGIAGQAGGGLLFEDLKYLLTDHELKQYRVLSSDRQKMAFFHGFWSVRNPTPADATNPRLVEHFRRFSQAEGLYEYFGFRTRFSDPDRMRVLTMTKSFSLNKEFNDKGLIFLRHGAPDKTERSMGSGTMSQGDPHESWLYEATAIDPQRIFHFAMHNAVGTNWRLTPLPSDPRIIENIAMWDLRYLRLVNGNQLEAAARQVELETEQKETVAEAFTTDRYAWERGTTMLFLPHSIDAFRSDRGRTLLDVSYAIPIAPVQKAFGDSVKTILMEVGLAVTSADGRKLVSGLDTVHLSLEGPDAGSFLSLFRLTVHPDSVRVAMHVRGLGVPVAGVWDETSRIPSFAGEDFKVSALQLLLPSSQGPSIEIDGVKVVQSPFSAYTRSSRLYGYVQAYNLVKDLFGKAACTIRYTLLRRGEDEGEIVLAEDTRSDLTESMRADFHALDLATVEPGIYTLTVAVTDRKRVQTLTRSRVIEILK